MKFAFCRKDCDAGVFQDVRRGHGLVADPVHFAQDGVDQAELQGLLGVAEEAYAEYSGLTAGGQTGHIRAETRNLAAEVRRIRRIGDACRLRATCRREILLETVGEAIAIGIIKVENGDVLVAARDRDAGVGLGRKGVRRIHDAEDVVTSDAACRGTGGRRDENDIILIGKLLGAKHLGGGQRADDDVRAGGLHHSLHGAGGSIRRPFCVGGRGLEANVRTGSFQFRIHLLYRQVNTACEIGAKGSERPGKGLHYTEYPGFLSRGVENRHQTQDQHNQNKRAKLHKTLLCGLFSLEQLQLNNSRCIRGACNLLKRSRQWTN